MRTIETINYNNKLCNDVFIHIDKAPAAPMKESDFPVPVLFKEIKKGNLSALDMLNGTANQQPALQVETEMFDFLRLPANSIPSVLTYMSHGVDPDTFVKTHLPSNDVHVALYMFKRKK